MKLFEFAVIYNPLPTKDQNERGEKPNKLAVRKGQSPRLLGSNLWHTVSHNLKAT